MINQVKIRQETLTCQVLPHRALYTVGRESYYYGAYDSILPYRLHA